MKASNLLCFTKYAINETSQTSLLNKKLSEAQTKKQQTHYKVYIEN